ncbi:Uncharacterised protein [Mycobacteroides abscessus subsp. abscessus]|nr:Uncharacterised protein [Mycobacteroides abscessus subsp. abscessus]
MPNTVTELCAPARALSLARTASNPSTAQGPKFVQTTLVSTPNSPSTLAPCGWIRRCESRCKRR